MEHNHKWTYDMTASTVDRRNGKESIKFYVRCECGANGTIMIVQDVLCKFLLEMGVEPEEE